MSDSKRDVKIGWLNSIAGRIEQDDTHAGEPNYLHVAYSTKCPKESPNIFTFGSCPRCKKCIYMFLILRLKVMNHFSFGFRTINDTTTCNYRCRKIRIYAKCWKESSSLF